MKTIARWLGQLARAFSDGFKRVDKQPKWQVTIEFAHGSKRAIEVSEETWKDMKKWMDGLNDPTNQQANGSLYLLETDGQSLRLVREYVCVLEGKRR